jgi:hypothetical protein
MAIIASSNGSTRELIPAGNYIARCYQMIQIGTVQEQYMGETKVLPKVRIGWELPLETRVFKEENGEQPLVIAKEYTLSMNEKANLRKDLASWRGKDFSEEEAKSFDVTNLLGKACMLNIIHKASKSDASKVYEQIAGITPMPKGMIAPQQINKTVLLTYDAFDTAAFEKLPDFIKTKMKTSQEYQELMHPQERQIGGKGIMEEPETVEDDLPF